PPVVVVRVRYIVLVFFFFFQAEDGIRDFHVTGVQTCALPICSKREPIIGRSIIYGVKFINSDLEQRQRLKFLTNYWNESKKIKRSEERRVGKECRSRRSPYHESKKKRKRAQE